MPQTDCPNIQTGLGFIVLIRYQFANDKAQFITDTYYNQNIRELDRNIQIYMQIGEKTRWSKHPLIFTPESLCGLLFGA